MHFYIKEIYKKGKKLMKTRESQLQTTFTPGPKMPFTPGPWLHPELKIRPLVPVLIITRD